MTVVLDASTALELLMEDENSPVAPLAERLFRSGHTAIVPALFIHEVTNALVTAVRRGRVDVENALVLLDRLVRLPIEVDDRTSRAPDILALAVRQSLSAYDAAYLELALATGQPLATKDSALARAATREGASLAGADSAD